MGTVQIRDVHKSYGSVEVLHGVSIDIEDGEFVALVGPSGCGKSTLLRMIAGLEDISRGDIHIGGRVVNYIAPKDRDIAMVFQNYALYPHMYVLENMGFALRQRRFPRADIDERVTTRPASWGRGLARAQAARSSPAVSASASRWVGRSCAIRPSSCSTNRFPISMPSCACRCVSE